MTWTGPLASLGTFDRRSARGLTGSVHLPASILIAASRVAIIANAWKTLNDNVAAVQDRGHVLIFEPTALEVHQQVARWFWDQGAASSSTAVYSPISDSSRLRQRTTAS